MLTVGLTGGIGAGKSAASALLAGHGAVLVDADVVAREVVAAGTAGLAAVVQAFGTEVLAADGSLDRPAVGALVFADSGALQRLNAIVHPLIAQRSTLLMQQAERDDAELLVHDVPLLVENGLGPRYHLVLVVHAPVQQRLARLTGRGLPVEQALARMAAQASDEDRRAAADVWLDNGGTRKLLAEQVGGVYQGRLQPYARNLASGRAAERGPVRIVAPDPAWPAAAARLARRLKQVCGATALAVEHIGSTAVPELPAKDVIDLQVEVSHWEDVESLGAPLAAAGFPRREDVAGDPVRPELDPDPSQYRKRLHRSADPGRAVNVHLRATGTTAGRAALAFRDLLRADPTARQAYAQVKLKSAARYPTEVDAYAEAKTAFIVALLTDPGRTTG